MNDWLDELVRLRQKMDLNESNPMIDPTEEYDGLLKQFRLVDQECADQRKCIAAMRAALVSAAGFIVSEFASPNEGEDLMPGTRSHQVHELICEAIASAEDYQ